MKFVINKTNLHNVSTRRLVEMERKWQKMVARGRRMISLGSTAKSNLRRKAPSIEEKGHFVAYKGTRFPWLASDDQSSESC
uniref:Uncharacterized protein n=1 Tax=Nymphaea colorata TaxID=210225 RepID=A0A5K0ZX76_9MAGN